MKKIMIAVSTEQNTTNVLPALQLEIDSFMFIETSLANKKQWSNGATEVLEKYNINVEPPIILSEEQDSRIDLIIKRIKEYLQQKGEYSIIWNIGGGQKAQQMAIWQIFTDRSRAGATDNACYTNPYTEQIENWVYKDDKLEYSFEKIKSKLKIDEILEIFGFTNKNTGKHITDFKINNDNLNLWKNKTFRSYFYLLSKHTDRENSQAIEKREVRDFIKESLKQIKEDFSKIFDKVLVVQEKETFNKNYVKNIFDKAFKNYKIKITDEYLSSLEKQVHKIENLDNDFLKICKDKQIEYPCLVNFDNFQKLTQTLKPAIFFEELLFAAIKENYFEKQYADCSFNTDVYPKNSDKKIAEYDVLIATKAGKLISLDAKTFNFHKKDADARLQNMTEAGGRYVKFIPVFPFDKEDCKQDYYPVKIKGLMNRLNENKTEFYVLSSDIKSKEIFDLDFGSNTIEIKTVNNLLE